MHCVYAVINIHNTDDYYYYYYENKRKEQRWLIRLEMHEIWPVRSGLGAMSI